MKTKTEKNQTNHPKAVSREESLAERLELLAIATTAGPAPAGDVVATVYKDSSGSNIYVEPLPPQSLACVKPLGQPVVANIAEKGKMGSYLNLQRSCPYLLLVVR